MDLHVYSEIALKSTMPETASGLLSPTPSVRSEVAVPSGILPVARTHPLQTGSVKFNALRNYLDSRIYEINGKLSKSFAGYTTFPDVHKDLNAAIDVLWISNTSALQVPFLITLSGLYETAIHAFPWDSSRALAMVAKLDEFFARLLSDDHDSSGYVITNTDKARINSIVSRLCSNNKALLRNHEQAQETRLEIATAASRTGVVSELPSATNTDTEAMMTEDEDEDMDDGSTPQALSLGDVYEKTLSILGADLNSLPTQDATVQDPQSSHSGVDTVDL